MQYQTVFDILTAGDKVGSFANSGLTFVVIGILLVVFSSIPLFSKNFKKPLYFKIFSVVFLVLSVSDAIFTHNPTFSEYDFLISEYNAGHFQVAEGNVTNFIPMPDVGHSMESFCVDSSPCFEYSDYDVTAGFNNAKSLGGPISEGLPVRVS